MHRDDRGRQGVLTSRLARSGGLWWTRADPEILLKTEGRRASTEQAQAQARGAHRCGAGTSTAVLVNKGTLTE